MNVLEEHEKHMLPLARSSMTFHSNFPICAQSLVLTDDIAREIY
jgi:hypothetical protein